MADNRTDPVKPISTQPQTCQVLFVELATDNFETAGRLANEIRDIEDKAEKKATGKRILNAISMFLKFSRGVKRNSAFHRYSGG